MVWLRDGRAAAVRPARPADGAAVQQFVRGLSALARRRRFLGAIAELSPAQLDRLTHPRDPRDLSLLALAAGTDGVQIVGMAQYAIDDPSSAEFAVVVADAWHHHGLGERLLEILLASAAAAGVKVVEGFVLPENAPMLALAAKLGFGFTPAADPALVRIEKPLPPRRPASWILALLRRLVAPHQAAAGLASQSGG
jgi:acetyltransferase